MENKKIENHTGKYVACEISKYRKGPRYSEEYVLKCVFVIGIVSRSFKKIFTHLYFHVVLL